MPEATGRQRSVDRGVEKHRECSAASPMDMTQLDRTRDEIRRKGVNRDVPKARTPGQSWGPPDACEMADQETGQRDDRHEIATPVERSTPTNEYGDGAQK